MIGLKAWLSHFRSPQSNEISVTGSIERMAFASSPFAKTIKPVQVISERRGSLTGPR